MIRIDTLRHCQNFHTHSLTCGERAIIVEKTKWKPLEQPLPRKLVKYNQYHIPGGMAEINATIEDLNYVAVMVLTTSSFNSPMGPTRKTDGSWRKCVIIYLTRW